jgi:hypothetical protein
MTLKRVHEGRGTEEEQAAVPESVSSETDEFGRKINEFRRDGSRGKKFSRTVVIVVE